MKKYLLFAAIAVSCLSCATDRLYRTLSMAGGSRSEKQIYREISRMLHDSLPDASHIIYVYHPFNHMPAIGTTDFEGVLYNFNSKKAFYFENHDQRSLQVQLINDERQSMLMRFVLGNYLQDNISYLDSCQNKNISEGGAGYTYLFDINNKKETVRHYQWYSILLNKNGKPVNLSDYIQQK